MLILVFQKFQQPLQNSQPLTYTKFLQEVKDGNIASVDIQDQTITAKTKTGEKFLTHMPPNDPKMIDDLLANNVEVKAIPPKEHSILWDIIISWAPFLLIIGLWVYIMRQMQGGGGKSGPMSFGKSRARMMTEDQVKVN